MQQLHDLVPAIPQPDNNSEWHSKVSTSIEVRADVEGETGQQIAWLAGAKAGVKASFGSEAVVSALGAQKWFHQCGDMDEVRSTLRNAAENGHLKEGDAIIVERQLTGKGVIFVSQGGTPPSKRLPAVRSHRVACGSRTSRPARA